VKLRELTIDDIESLAVGTWILGTGGGGNPYLPLLNMRALYKEGHRVELMDPADLADDDWVGMAGGMGAPLVEQAAKLASKWARPGLDVVVEALAPSADANAAKQAAERLAAQKPDLVAMDCMSYTPTTKEWVKPALGVPALLAITATGRVLREMLE
jgi:hypothetical protein